MPNRIFAIFTLWLLEVGFFTLFALAIYVCMYARLQLGSLCKHKCWGLLPAAPISTYQATFLDYLWKLIFQKYFTLSASRHFCVLSSWCFLHLSLFVCFFQFLFWQFTNCKWVRFLHFSTFYRLKKKNSFCAL